jgi:hypothetical protein
MKVLMRDRRARSPRATQRPHTSPVYKRHTQHMTRHDTSQHNIFRLAALRAPHTMLSLLARPWASPACGSTPASPTPHFTCTRLPSPRHTQLLALPRRPCKCALARQPHRCVGMSIQSRDLLMSPFSPPSPWLLTPHPVASVSWRFSILGGLKPGSHFWGPGQEAPYA